MTKLGSENEFPIIRLLEDPTPPTTPGTGRYYLYVPASGKTLHGRDDTGTIIDYAAGVDDILDLPTAEMDDTLVLAPDGAGGVEFRAESGGGGGAVTVQETRLGADVAMASANTYYDILSLSLADGTYLLRGKVLYDGNGNSLNGTAKLWDGTTVEDSSHSRTTSSQEEMLYLFGYVVVTGGPVTWKISVAGDGASTMCRAAAQINGAGNTASVLIAEKIA